MNNKLKILFFYSILGTAVFIFSLKFVNADPLNLWQDSGLNLYYTAGNVGIGTADPASYASTLAVIGTIYAGSDVNVNSRLLLGGTNTLSYSGTDVNIANNSYWQSLGFYTNAVRQLSITSNGNVGIGTTSPSQKLSVNGNIYTNGGFCLNGVCITNWEDSGLSTTTSTINNNDIGYITYISTPTGGYYYIPFLYYIFVLTGFSFTILFIFFCYFILYKKK